ncbi:hypothetical protein E3J51_05400 [Candidatus Bathyarchaeota archaeon]|nr:MAG: hypothetical protein E3J51_05400 [Candidatus Bathyarchaeota archaeon]
MGQDTEQEEPLQFVKSVFKVLYSPMKAFEEIGKKPSVKGPILILLITLPLFVSIQYSSTSKFFLETTIPENDLWTEEPHNSHSFLWSSGDEILFDNTDYISGNYSVSISAFNSSQIWMYLTEIGSINCSEGEHSRLSLAIKISNEEELTTAALQLFSGNNDPNGFELDILPLIGTVANTWVNITVDLANDNWTKTTATSSWTDITGIGFQLTRLGLGNFTVKVDGLFFGKFVSSASSYGVDLQLLSVVRSSINFLLEWLILSGVVLLLLRSFSKWTGSFKDLFYYIGHVYSASIVYLSAIALTSFFLPPLYIPANITFQQYVNIYQASWGAPISYLTLLYYGWATILCAVSLKKLVEMSWSKAILVGFGAFVMGVLFSSFLLSVFF